MDWLRAQVHFASKDAINRDTCVENEVLLSHTLKHLGTRVSVQTLEVHIESCYCLQSIAIPRD